MKPVTSSVAVNNDWLHLLLKFRHLSPYSSKEIELNTIQEHRKICDKHGKVWWGTAGHSIGQLRVEQLKSQLSENSSPVWVFLYASGVPKSLNSDGNLWYRARLLDVSVSKPSETQFIPEYYRNDTAGSYVLISEIEPLIFEAGHTPKVPGQAAVRYILIDGQPTPDNIKGSDGRSSLCVGGKELAKLSHATKSEVQLPAHLPLPEDLSMKVIGLQDEVLRLQTEVLELRTYKEFYGKLLGTDYMFSSEKFFEWWIKENIHRIAPELEILDQQPRATWPDGKFGRLDLLAINKETNGLVIIEVKTRKRDKTSGYDQFIRYMSWAKRNLDSIGKKYDKQLLQSEDCVQFVIITDFVNAEMKAICKDHSISLIQVLGGFDIQKLN